MSLAEPMPNEQFEPNELQERILERLKDGRDEGRPWGITTPSIVGGELNEPRQYTSRELGSLEDAGWVKSIGNGVYEFVEDPRERNDD